MLACFLIPQRPVQFSLSLANRIGLVEALVLQQVYYLLNDPDNDIRISGKPYLDNIAERCSIALLPLDSEIITDAIGQLIRENYLVYATIKGIEEFITINDDKIIQSANCQSLQHKEAHKGMRLTPRPTRQAYNHPNQQTRVWLDHQVQKIAHHMLVDWNRINHPGLAVEKIANLTVTESHSLVNFWTDFILIHAVEWQEYCQKLPHVAALYLPRIFGIKDLTLKWATNPVHAVKVMEAIEVDTPDRTYPYSPKSCYAEEHAMAEHPLGRQWQDLWQGIAQYCPQGQCRVLFSGSKITTLTATRLVLQVPTLLMKDCIVTFMRHEFKYALTEMMPEITEVIIQVENSTMWEAVNLDV